MTVLKSLPIGILGLSLIAAGANARKHQDRPDPAADGSVAYNGTTDVNGSKLALDETTPKRRARQKG